MGQQHIRKKLKLYSGTVWYLWYTFFLVVLLLLLLSWWIACTFQFLLFWSFASQRGEFDVPLDQDKEEKRKLEQKLLSFTNSHLGTSFHTLEFISFCQQVTDCIFWYIPPYISMFIGKLGRVVHSLENEFKDGTNLLILIGLLEGILLLMSMITNIC